MKWHLRAGFCLHIRLFRGFHFILCAFRRLF